MNICTYARVSTHKQDLDVQRDRLKKWASYKNFNVVRAFEDTKSGKDANRIEYQEMMRLLRRKVFDGVAFDKLDRIGRSLKEHIAFVEEMNALNRHIFSLSEAIDTTTPQGMLYFHIMGALAQFERDRIMERTAAGKAYVREKAKREGGHGTKSGKPMHRPFIDLPVDEIGSRFNEGVPIARLARDYKVSPKTIKRRLDTINRSDVK